jgi:peroxiredoxin (alkyl hydroperoxide reductase subunit C)
MVVAVQRQAPAFTAPSVVDGQFKDISLADYLGQWFVPGHGENSYC